MARTDWRKVPCPKCKRKGLHVPRHPHAFTFKDSGKLECRFCHARFMDPDYSSRKLPATGGT